MKPRTKKILYLVTILILLCGNIDFISAQTGTPLPLPKLTIGIDKAQKPEDVSMTLQILLIMTILSLAPAIVILMTSFTRIIIVFHFLKQALGTQQVPPSQVIVGYGAFYDFCYYGRLF